MGRLILFEEFHLGFFAPRGLTESEQRIIREILDDTRFHAQVRKVVREVIRGYAALRHVRLRLSQ